jgi:hypothetical protein
MEYERLKQEREIRNKIQAIDLDVAKYKKAKKAEKGALYKKLAELEKELESGAMQPGLFEKNETANGRIGESASYPEGEEKLSVISDQLSVKKEKKAKKDTMAVERTLLAVFPPCGEVQGEEVAGCCQCHMSSECDDRLVAFGNATACTSTTGCSSECPRVIQKKDIEEKAESNDRELFQKALKWYENTPEFKEIEGGKVGCRNVNDLRKALKIDDWENAAILYDRIIDFKAGLDDADGKPKKEQAADANVCATSDKDLANIAKVPKGSTIYKLDLENKTIFEYSFDRKEFSIPVEYKTKKACLDNFRELTSIDSCLDIDRPGTWPKKIAAKTGDVPKTLFRGDFHGSPYDKKQIRFIHSDASGWGKPRKFTNIEQYQAEIDQLRKNSGYIEN